MIPPASLSFLAAPSPLGDSSRPSCGPQPLGLPLHLLPTPALQVPGEQEEEAQGPLRAEEPDSRA